MKDLYCSSSSSSFLKKNLEVNISRLSLLFKRILSSVFLTTESHEKRMRVADQCVCVSLTVSRCGYFQSLNPYKSAPSPGFSIFYIPGEEGKAKFYNLSDFFFYSSSDSFPNVR